MLYKLVVGAVLGAACCQVASVRADDTDPIKEKLDQARTVYDAAMEKYQSEAKSYFDKRVASARSKGDKKAIDQTEEERQEFTEKGVLPKAAPATLKQKEVAARAGMEKAYTVAIKEYTKANKDVEAAVLEKELGELKGGTATVVKIDWQKIKKAIGSTALGGESGVWAKFEEGLSETGGPYNVQHVETRKDLVRLVENVRALNRMINDAKSTDSSKSAILRLIYGQSEALIKQMDGKGNKNVVSIIKQLRSSLAVEMGRK